VTLTKQNAQKRSSVQQHNIPYTFLKLKQVWHLILLEWLWKSNLFIYFIDKLLNTLILSVQVCI